MIETKRNADRSLSAWKVVLGLAVGLLAGSLPASADPISSIKDALDKINFPGFDSSSRTKEFQTFLAGGPDLWSRTRLLKIPEGTPVLKPSGELRNNRVVEYLAWGRDRNPALFDRRHPVLGAKLAAAGSLKGAQAPTTPAGTGGAATIPAGTNGAGSTPATPQAQMLQPPRIALETLTPPIPSTGFNPPLTQELSSSSVVTTNVIEPIEQSQEGGSGSPAPIPEPSTVALMLLLFGAAACWNRGRSGGRRPEV
jgi:hypothetical protein